MSAKERVGKVFGRHPPDRDRDIEKRTKAVEQKSAENVEQAQKAIDAFWDEVRRADGQLRKRVPQR